MPNKKKMTKKKSFPDLNKDGKITRADILKGRGVKLKNKKTTAKKKKKK
jgi:hypothetical protein|tara:strand:+ start:515 stop:661 length:147 start_codon:yes stop_codon:yes gene_type:complete